MASGDRTADRADARPAPVEHRGGLRARRPRPLLLHPRVARPGPGVARPLPRPRPAPALRVPATRAAGAEPPPRARTDGCSRPRSTSSSSVRSSRRSPTPRSRSRLRDPVAVLQSAITMLAYGDRVRRVQIEPTDSPPTGSTASSGCCRPRSATHDLIPDAQRVDVEFGAFMADDLAMARQDPRRSPGWRSPTGASRARRLPRRQPAGQGGPGRLRPTRRLRPRPGRAPRALRFYFDAFPQIRREVN